MSKLYIYDGGDYEINLEYNDIDKLYDMRIISEDNDISLLFDEEQFKKFAKDINNIANNYGVGIPILDKTEFENVIDII